MFTMSSMLHRCIISLGLAAALSQVALADSMLAPGQIKFGMEISYPPFESYEGDKVVGFDPELATLIAEQLKAKPSFHDTKFTGLILGLGANKFDAVISGMYITPERIQQADGIPYARTGALIMVLKDSPVQPKTEHDLCGLKVGLEQGTVWVKTLKELSEKYCAANGKPAVTVQEFPSAPEVSQALLSKNVQAQLEIAGAAKMFVDRSKGRIRISSPALVYPQTLGMYVKKGNSELKRSLEQALATLRGNGKYAALLKKYNLDPVSE